MILSRCPECVRAKRCWSYVIDAWSHSESAPRGTLPSIPISPVFSPSSHPFRRPPLLCLALAGLSYDDLVFLDLFTTYFHVLHASRLIDSRLAADFLTASLTSPPSSPTLIIPSPEGTRRRSQHQVQSDRMAPVETEYYDLVRCAISPRLRLPIWRVAQRGCSS